MRGAGHRESSVNCGRTGVHRHQAQARNLTVVVVLVSIRVASQCHCPCLSGFYDEVIGEFQLMVRAECLRVSNSLHLIVQEYDAVKYRVVRLSGALDS